ncbi:hypothetical protein E4U53_002619 [Claviceps sorghi]|nr:hypothetical protein E4U53_002619 [Claviceps sorghi]
MKSNDTVIQEFNDLVNMTASELEKWLKSSDSNSAGWSKDSEDGESVGHDSGRKIVEILKDNPQKNPDKYSDEQIDHMRKVVAYWADGTMIRCSKRHLAQESAANAEKSTEELKKTKSYASLKNWGHDILKKQNGKADNSEEAEAGDKRSRQDGPTGDNKVRKTNKSSTAKDEKSEEEKGEEEKDEEEEEEEDADVADVDGDDDGDDGEDADQAEDDEDQADDDEDQAEDDEDGADEASEERQTRSKAKGKKNPNKSTKPETDDDDGVDKKGNQKDTSSSKSKNGEPDPGDTVSWNWGQGQPKGKVLDVKHEKTSIETKGGNEVSRDGSDKDPAVVLDTGKSKAIKLNHELN